MSPRLQDVGRYISSACEAELRKHGDNWRGAGYTRSEQQAREQYALMLGVVREPDEPVCLLDLGCGLAHLLDFKLAHPRYDHVRYSGSDLSEAYLAAAKKRHPEAELFSWDALSDANAPSYDYIIMNGLFNYRGAVGEEVMLDYWQALVAAAFAHCRRGIAFNVMSKLVDWERQDLFHLPFDTMARRVAAALSRRFVVRHDYQAFEYTVYVYREPARF